MDNARTINLEDGLVLYDGVCKFCNASVRFILDHEKNDRLKFVPLQSVLGVELLNRFDYPSNYTSSILVLVNNRLIAKSAAVFSIAKYLKRPFSFISVFKFFPSFISDYFYDVIARNRYKLFGRSATCMRPPENHEVRFLES